MSSIARTCHGPRWGHNLTDLFRKIELCRQKAERCEENAAGAMHPIIRASYLRAAEAWRRMAEDTARSLERFRGLDRQPGDISASHPPKGTRPPRPDRG